MVWVVLFILFGFSFGEEVRGKCELRYDRCVYDCANRYPFDQNRRTGCEIRCKLNYAVCESVRVIDRAGKEIREFLEGFSEGGGLYFYYEDQRPLREAEGVPEKRI
ncbi:MAG: hypothetical protein Q9N26_07425 [Aquificota bacterium]|nr:hypothetical protein [Aquificota bacterium]